jgi:hypothetical protein
MALKVFSSGEVLFASDLNDNFNELDGLISTAVQSTDVSFIVVLTQAEYDALDPVDETTFYIVTEDV